ncbi:MAG TPA: glycosyltransferase family 2 protein [Candidatus Baltobacterales bacterium]|nr:glycosyltransferase family 2 protein [Candidatus Baltobacterales bacterium]
MSAQGAPGGDGRPASAGGTLLWSAVLNTILVAAFVVGAIPIVAIIRGFADMVAQSKIHSGADWVAYGLAFTGLFLGAIFFAYAIKYYLSTVMVLLTTLVTAQPRNGNHNGGPQPGPTNDTGLTRINGDGNGNGYHIDLGYHPFVSVHVAAYNEKRVIERLLTALDQLDYPAYEVVVVDDSTDESVQILQRWEGNHRFKILHRTSREGYKGGALREALKVTDPRTEYVVVFDADSVPFPDSIDRLLPLFYRVSDGTSNRRMEAAFGRAEPPSEPGQIKKRAEVAAVQSYQWHVLNKSESWLTEAVRAEYAGSYMVERPFQDAVGALKMIAGTAYMIRADVLREVGWGTSITEDWELTLKLYARGYKVVYTPWAETPAECVSTFARLARQRMRWAEGHTYNVRKWFLPVMQSPFVSPLEKIEFLFDTTYYLQAGLFLIGSVSWLISEVVFHAHVPGWTALLGWSLLFSNIFALPLMNLGGLILEEAPLRDMQGVFGALVLSFALVPFQGWAAFKGLISKDEGPWFRTPKTGHVTDEVHHLRRLQLLRRWIQRRGKPGGKIAPPPRQAKQPTGMRGVLLPSRWLGWLLVGALIGAFGSLAWLGSRAPVVSAAGNPLYLHGTGTAPACVASTFDQTIGTRMTGCQIQSAAGGVTTVWAFANLSGPQNVAAGVWTFTMRWTGGSGSTNDTVTVAAGVSATASCTGFTAQVPNAGSTWTAAYGSGSTNPTSPLTVTTSASQASMVIPSGGTLCISVTLTHVTGGKPSMVYDGIAGVGDTSVVPPSIVVPESLVGFAGLAALIPLITSRRRIAALVRRRS